MHFSDLGQVLHLENLPFNYLGHEKSLYKKEQIPTYVQTPILEELHKAEEALMAVGIQMARVLPRVFFFVP